MNPKLAALLQELESFGEANDARATDRSHKMLGFSHGLPFHPCADCRHGLVVVRPQLLRDFFRANFRRALLANQDDLVAGLHVRDVGHVNHRLTHRDVFEELKTTHLRDATNTLG